jgi:outer membrane protein assembly factor BamB
MESPLQQSGYQFELLDGYLCKVETTTGKTIACQRPIGTSIVQALSVGSNIVLREDYYQFPRGQSNVYCLTKDFELVWSAELPGQDDVYANPIVPTSGGLFCAAWGGMDCTLDRETGRILQKVFTR